MVSHWSFSDSKSPQVFWILLSILTDLNNPVVWMVSTPLLIFKSSSPCTNPGTCTKSTNYNLYHCNFHVSQLFPFPGLSRGTYLSFHFLSVLLCGQLEQQIPLFSKYSLSGYYKVWSSNGDMVYLKVSEGFLRLIPQDRFWVVHIPIVSLVKFRFLAQFPVEHLPHSVVSRLILFMC